MLKKLGTALLPLAFTIPLLLLVFGLIFLLTRLTTTPSTEKPTQAKNSAVSEINGIQYIELTAKGGYFPNSITAKANISTVLRVKTTQTFDCSSALVIPSLDYRKNLPPNGTTEIEIPAQPIDATIQGMCSMGMYRFKIKFI
ncbi:MAG: hypothetical protein ACD_22C00215G0003 [uncultured bacterium]|nr:MAG: hypothetical protein ACD_22C00215G0003 [uncultured bacterium]